MPSQRELNKRLYEQIGNAADKQINLSLQAINIWNLNNLTIDELMRVILENDETIDLGRYRDYLVPTVMLLIMAQTLKDSAMDIRRAV